VQEEERAKDIERMNKWKLDLINSILDLIDLERGKEDKEAKVARIWEFLKAPKATSKVDLAAKVSMGMGLTMSGPSSLWSLRLVQVTASSNYARVTRGRRQRKSRRTRPRRSGKKESWIRPVVPRPPRERRRTAAQSLPRCLDRKARFKSRK
jgi:hypothetical protein